MMKRYRYTIPLLGLLALAGCHPPAVGYTAAEWPSDLVLDNAAHSFFLQFLPGSSRLGPADAARLRGLVASGQIAPSDRVMVATAGPPRLADTRFAAVSHELMRYGIAPVRVSLASVPRGGAVIESGRYLVTLPECPNWSKPPSRDYANSADSNFGCATAVNLGEMIASPADLARGRPLGPASALTEVSALGRYYSDKVYLAPSISLITSIGNANPVPPGAQVPAAGMSSLFTEAAPGTNPIAASGAGIGAAGSGEGMTRPAIGTPAPVPPGSIPPSGPPTGR